MNIDDLTIGQAKALVALLAPCRKERETGFYGRYVGKKVIVRSRNEGVNFGEVVACDETGIVLKNARRLWYHKPASPDESWYEGVANSGLSPDSRLSAAVAEKAIVENYGITVCSDVAVCSIEAIKSYAKN